MDRPSLFFDGINDEIISTNSLSSPASHLFIFSVWQKLLLSSLFSTLNLNHPSDASARVTPVAPFADGRVIWDAGNNTTERLQTFGGFNDLTQHIWTFIETPGTDNQIIKRDGIQLAQKTPVTFPNSVNQIILGASAPSASSSNMQFQELVFYDSNQLNNVVGIEDNFMKYWMPAFLNWVNGANNLVNGANNLVFRDEV